MDHELEKLLLSELRIAVYAKNNDASCVLTDEAMLRAVTVNEELRQLGYTLKPQDLAELAKSPSLDDFPQHFRSLMQDVTAKPMYPDFPKQVMAMDEAEFRFHQLMHYFSTYGIEEIFGIEVSRGWMPDVEETEKIKKDEILLEAKVLEFVPEDEAPRIAASRVLGRRNRLNDPDREIIVRAIPLLTPEDIGGIRVPFKENLIELFEAIMKSSTGERRLGLWRQICSHTGDVIKCVNGILPRHDYHFRTSQKKSIVRLLESYTEADFKANLILSRSKREKSLKVLQFLDYNMYSRSAEHKEAVRALRNGELRSWDSQAKYLLTSGDEGALDFIAARPGTMLRMLNWLLNLGYTADELTDKLMPQAGKLSPNTMIKVINAMDYLDKSKPDEQLYKSQVYKLEGLAKKKKVNCIVDHSEQVLEEKKQVAAARHERWCRKQIDEIEANHSLGWLERRRKKAELRKEHENLLLKLEELKKRQKSKDYVDILIHGIDKWHERSYKGLTARYQADCHRYDRIAGNTGTIRKIMKTLLARHLEEKDTSLRGRKIYLDKGIYDLAGSRMTAGEKSDDGGYLSDGMLIRIPDEVNYLRLFVYWNDKRRVDVDLHVTAVDMEDNFIHVGWSGSYEEGGIVHSGDITTSDAAEFIDIDMGAPIRYATADIDLYDGKPNFGAIETCYVGMMAVGSIDEEVALYDPANCFFTHELRSNNTFIHYGKIDVQNRAMYHAGKSPEKWTEFTEADGLGIEDVPSLTVQDYIDMLLSAQGAEVVDKPEEAEVILSIDKSSDERAISLCDRNFFLEA